LFLNVRQLTETFQTKYEVISLSVYVTGTRRV